MQDHSEKRDLPEIIQQYLSRLSKRIRPRHARADVLAELRAHFADALANISEHQNRDELAQSLLADFGDTKILAKLIKRAKKRCYPMWLKVIGYTCRTIIITFVILICYTIWFVRGKPTITVDYFAKFNEMVRPTADESLNAAPHYLKANEMFVPAKGFPTGALRGRDGPGSTLTPDRRLLLDKWLSENKRAAEELRLGTTKLHCWFHYDTGQTDSQPPLDSLLIPSLGNLRNLALVLCWRMQFSAEQGRWDLVSIDLQSLKGLAKHLMRCPTLIEQLIGMGNDRWSSRQLIYVLRNYSPPRESLDTLATIFHASFPSGYPIADMGFETLSLLDNVQRVFTDDGSGDGHFIPSSAVDLFVQGGRRTSTLYYLLPNPFDAPPEFVLRSLIHPSRSETVGIIEQWKQMSDRYRSMTPYQNHISSQPVDAWILKIIEENPRNLFIKSRLPATQRVTWHSYIGRTYHDAAQTVVALLRYKAERGQFPEKLDELVPEFLKAIPQDPFGPEALSYERQGEDFVLYSWGLDFKDDGGKHNKEVFRIRNRDGDYVFWPPAPVERPGPARRTGRRQQRDRGEKAQRHKGTER